MSTENMWYLYVVRCSDNTLYTGITTGRTDVPQEELDFTGQLYDAANLMADEGN